MRTTRMLFSFFIFSRVFSLQIMKKTREKYSRKKAATLSVGDGGGRAHPGRAHQPLGPRERRGAHRGVERVRGRRHRLHARCQARGGGGIACSTSSRVVLFSGGWISPFFSLDECSKPCVCSVCCHVPAAPTGRACRTWRCGCAARVQGASGDCPAPMDSASTATPWRSR